jgi:ketosteroid isomerase-like protein
MGDEHDLAHRTLQDAFHNLVLGNAEALNEACSPDATWWLPVDDGDRLSATEACARLTRLLGTAHTAHLAAVIVAPDAEQAVVELVAERWPDADATNATTVLELRGGQITSGNTYFDPAAWR